MENMTKAEYWTVSPVEKTPKLSSTIAARVQSVLSRKEASELPGMSKKHLSELRKGRLFIIPKEEGVMRTDIASHLKGIAGQIGILTLETLKELEERTEEFGEQQEEALAA